ncbi:MAG TPA: 30S ribosomal protein S12 methylthiotransferase RimO [Actinobacteria bacterium]|nr:30S ribosomal protein S12 methylthiotransferase RimO [Actinomycetota bacterium]
MSSPSVWLTTLGCAKNQVDSDKVSGLLEAVGFRMSSSPEDADIVMVNTCAFIGEARRESIGAILDAEQFMRPDARLVVLGCMAQRYGGEISDAIPEVDAVVGIDRYPELVETLAKMTDWQPVALQRSPMAILHEVRRTSPAMPYAYLKIAEGCDKGCTFCAIPSFRGRQQSRPAAEIAAEAAGLVKEGVTELVLVAQDLAAYGHDTRDPDGITGLVHRIARTPGLHRLRLLYLYPSEIRAALIDEIVSNPVVATYFDLSLQHAEPKLLRAMARPGGGERYLSLIGRIRAAAPEAALRSSFIVGFPGETETDVQTMADFLEAARLDWAGFFPYSAEEGTPAALLPARVDPIEVTERARHLQRIQERITAERQVGRVGEVVDVLVDQVEDGVAVGRSFREAPEIDGMITLDRGAQGSWVRAKISGAYGPDLEGEVQE